MKKLFIIAVIVIFATIACKGGNTEHPIPPQPPVVLPEVTITAPKDIEVKQNFDIVAELNKIAENDITIKIINSNPKILSLPSDEIKIVKGEKSGKITSFGNAYGGVTVSFNSSEATIKTPEITISFPIIDHRSQYAYPEFEGSPYSAISKIVIGDFTIETSATISLEDPNGPLVGRDDFSTFGISDDKMDNWPIKVPLTDNIPFTIYYDNFNFSKEIEMVISLHIDWDLNFSFDDEGETIILEKGVIANAKHEISGIISIPKYVKFNSIIRVICYPFENSDITSGVGFATSGNLIDFQYIINK